MHLYFKQVLVWQVVMLSQHFGSFLSIDITDHISISAPAHLGDDHPSAAVRALLNLLNYSRPVPYPLLSGLIQGVSGGMSHGGGTIQGVSNVVLWGVGDVPWGVADVFWG